MYLEKNPFTDELLRPNPSMRTVELNRTSALWGFLLTYVLAILFTNYFYN